MPLILRAFLASLLLSVLAVASAGFLPLPPEGYRLLPAGDPDAPRPSVEVCGCAAPIVVIATMNLLDPALVEEVESDLEREIVGAVSDDDLALGLLERLLADGVIEPGVYTLMVRGVRECVLPRELMVLFQFDVVTGLELLRDALERIGVLFEGEVVDLGMVLRRIALLGDEFERLAADDFVGLVLPPARLLYVCEADARDAIRRTLDVPDVLAGLQDRYRDAISPLVARDAVDPRAVVPAAVPVTPRPPLDEACGCPAPLAVVGYMDVIDPLLVEDVRRGVGGDASDDVAVAVALLDRLLADGVIERTVYALMVGSVETCPLPRELLALFLFDVMTGVEGLPDALARIEFVTPEQNVTVAVVLRRIAAQPAEFDRLAADDLAGLELPPADLEVICEDDVREALRQTVERPGNVDRIRDRYGEAIAPIADGSLTNPN